MTGAIKAMQRSFILHKGGLHRMMYGEKAIDLIGTLAKILGIIYCLWCIDGTINIFIVYISAVPTSTWEQMKKINLGYIITLLFFGSSVHCGYTYLSFPIQRFYQGSPQNNFFGYSRFVNRNVRFCLAAYTVYLGITCYFIRLFMGL